MRARPLALLYVLPSVFLFFVASPSQAAPCTHALYVKRGGWIDPRASARWTRQVGHSAWELLLQYQPGADERVNQLRAELPAGAELWAWVGLRLPGGRWGGEQTRWLGQKAAEVRAAGFVGLHLNVEPLADSSVQALGDAARALMARGVRLGLSTYWVAGGAVVRQKAEPWVWSPRAHELLAGAFSQRVVMLYDSGLRTPQAYTQEVRRTWEALQSQAQGLRLGFPTFKIGRGGLHDPRSETLRAGLQALEGLWPENGCPEGSGIGIFIEDEMKKSDWALIQARFPAKVGA